MRAGVSKSGVLPGNGHPGSLLARDVKRTADIVAIASCFTRLRRTGSQWLGLCPLPDHNERHPSFYVHPRGVWYCHGCMRGGDVFRLVMLIKGADFPTALHFVADFCPSGPLVRRPKAVERGRRSRPAPIAGHARTEPIPAKRTDLPPLVCAADLAWEQEQAALRGHRLFPRCPSRYLMIEPANCASQSSLVLRPARGFLSHSWYGRLIGRGLRRVS